MESIWLGVVKSLVVSAVTVLATFFVNRSWKKWKNAQVHKKYPVAGRYITYYEDERDGTKVSTKAPLTLQQTGYRVRGATANLERKREWTVEGEIVGHGMLSGIYYPSSPHDPGRGIFFMEPKLDKENEYTGIWAGYDSINKGVRCGKYYWRKLKPVVLSQISAESDSKNVAQALLGTGLGNNYIDELEFREYVRPDSDGLAVAACTNDELSGVLLVKKLDKETTDNYGTLTKNAGSSVPLATHQLGLLKSVVVKTDYREQGIGTELCLEGVRRLKAAGCTAIIAFSWKSGSEDNSAGMLEGVGFHVIAQIKEFWKEDSTRKGYKCPTCGNPCKCDAFVFLKLL